jgi:hypothetical protein
MAMQNDGNQEAQTQDALDLDQQSLDVDQGIQDAPAFVPTEQYNQMLQQQQSRNDQLQRHISGLESRMDTRANEVTKQLGDIASASARAEIERREQELLSGIEDPAERDRMKTMLELQNLRNPQVAPVPEQPQVASQPQAQQATAADWQQVQSFVQNFGVNPNDPRIQYSILTDTNLSAEQRQQQFLANVGQIAATVTPAAQQGQQQAAPTPTPTRASGPVGTGYRSMDDVYDAFNSNQIDTETFKATAAKFGVVV